MIWSGLTDLELERTDEVVDVAAGAAVAQRDAQELLLGRLHLEGRAERLVVRRVLHDPTPISVRASLRRGVCLSSIPGYLY